MVVFHFSAVIASLFVLQLEQDPLLLADAFLAREEIIFSHCQVGCLIHSLQLFCYIKLQSLYCEGKIGFNPSCPVTMASLLNCSRDACVAAQDLQRKWMVLAGHSFMAS